MPTARHRPWTTSVAMEALCARIADRHRGAIRVQKFDVVVANLARIIDAALTLSNKQGFHATSLRDLAKEAGLSMGALYCYFDSKEALLTMILEEVASTAIEVLSAPPDEVVHNPRAHLEWMIDTHVRLSEAMLPWFVFSFMEARFFPPTARKLAIDAEASTEKLFDKVIAQGAKTGVFRRDVALVAPLVKPLLQDWYVKRAKYRRRGTSIGDYVAAVTRLVESTLTNATPRLSAAS